MPLPPNQIVLLVEQSRCTLLAVAEGPLVQQGKLSAELFMLVDLFHCDLFLRIRVGERYGRYCKDCGSIILLLQWRNPSF